MVNKKNEYTAPKFRNLEEEDRYWHSHSPLMEGYEGKVQKKKQNRVSFLSIRLTGEELARLREEATRYGLAPSTYARQVLIHGMESPEAYYSPSDLSLSLCSLSPQDIRTAGRVLKQLLKLHDDIARLEAQVRIYRKMPETTESGSKKIGAVNPVYAHDKVRDK